jgi:hypothetical protein
MRAKKIHPKRVGFISSLGSFDEYGMQRRACPFCAQFVEEGHNGFCPIAKLQATIKRREATIRRLRKEAKLLGKSLSEAGDLIGNLGGFP